MIKEQRSSVAISFFAQRKLQQRERKIERVRAESCLSSPLSLLRTDVLVAKKRTYIRHTIYSEKKKTGRKKVKVKTLCSAASIAESTYKVLSVLSFLLFVFFLLVFRTQHWQTEPRAVPFCFLDRTDATVIQNRTTIILRLAENAVIATYPYSQRSTLFFHFLFHFLY